MERSYNFRSRQTFLRGKLFQGSFLALIVCIGVVQLQLLVFSRISPLFVDSGFARVSIGFRGLEGRDVSKVSMRNKSHREPERSHRPWGSPFALTSQELIRRPLNPEPTYVDPKLLEAAQQLDSEDVSIRREGAQYLQENLRYASSPTIMEKLLESLYHEDFQVRMVVARCFSSVGETDRWGMDPYVARLANRLKDDSTSPFERVLILEALGRMGEPAQLYSKFVGWNLEHEEWLVRLSALNCIGQLGPELQFHRSVIVRLLRDENDEIRKRAQQVLDQRPYEQPGWLKVQNPAWRVRVLKAIKGKSKR